MEALEISPTPSQAVFNGQIYLQGQCPKILGISPGNPHYYKTENLQRLLGIAQNNLDKVLLFIPDKISEHNYRAVGSRNPEKSARVKANRLRNKCKEAARNIGLTDDKYSFVKWSEEIEPSMEYTKAFLGIRDLYQVNDGFRRDIQDSTAAALRCMKIGRENADGSCSDSESGADIEEGVKYLLKELAFLQTVPNIYKNCDRFVLVYHRSWPVLEKYFGGYYDGVVRPCLGFVVYE